jgi:hypothetical protein
MAVLYWEASLSGWCTSIIRVLYQIGKLPNCPQEISSQDAISVNIKLGEIHSFEEIFSSPSIFKKSVLGVESSEGSVSKFMLQI